MAKDFSLLWYEFSPDAIPTPSEQAAAIDAFIQEFSLEAQGLPCTLEKLGSRFGVVTQTHSLAISAPDFRDITHPSEINKHWLTLLPCQDIIFVATSNSTARGSIAIWESNRLKRSFSADPFEIYENEGLPLAEERDFWSGKHPVQFAGEIEPVRTDIPFHPIELVEELIKTRLGFRYSLPDEVDRERISTLLFTPYIRTPIEITH